MSFLKYRLFYLIFSLSAMVFLYSYTYGEYGGFAQSISFDGGIRLTVLLPADMSRDTLEKAIEKSGLEKADLRQTDARENKYDIEFGPLVRDKYQVIVDKANSEERVKFEEKRRKTVLNENEPKQVFKERTVAGEIEELLLPALGVSSDKVVSREVISASVGADLFRQSTKAIIIALLLITVYVSFRFEFSFALGATIALVHDIILTLGYIGFRQIEPSVPVVAAVLTLIGYSINDTIIIFDRIRSNIQDRSELVTNSLIDSSIRSTLSRTIITSTTTLLSIVAILVSGAESLIDFAEILFFGIIIGTYSTICMASPIMQIYEKVRFSRHSG